MYVTKQEKMLKKLVYTKNKKDLVNLPADFVHTGIVYLDGETLTLEKPQ